MLNDRYSFGLWGRACFKNPFAGSSPPPAPTPASPPPVPDVNDPQNLAARRQVMAKANSSGRSSTMLTTPAAPTLASGGYTGTKAGG